MTINLIEITVVTQIQFRFWTVHFSHTSLFTLLRVTCGQASSTWNFARHRNASFIWSKQVQLHVTWSFRRTDWLWFSRNRFEPVLKLVFNRKNSKTFDALEVKFSLVKTRFMVINSGISTPSRRIETSFPVQHSIVSARRRFEFCLRKSCN